MNHSSIATWVVFFYTFFLKKTTIKRVLVSMVIYIIKYAILDMAS